jgi:MerR family transcriptional regulator, heat shock protein HspR
MIRDRKRKPRRYSIGVVAETFGIHEQTLRLYEREGLLVPSRSEKNTRYYTDDDLERLQMILNLTRDMGVNLAGVQIIMNMREKMDEMQRQFNALLNFVRENFAHAAPAESNALVRTPPGRIVLVRTPETPERPALQRPRIIKVEGDDAGREERN